MIETQISILVNRKSDEELIKNSIINCKIQSPIYIFEYEKYFRINITSDYEEWELETEILKYFPDYKFTENLEKGRKEIRLQLSRYQSELCTNGWGKPIEGPLDETKYLVRKSQKASLRFNPKITVLFEDNEKDYYVNIVDGINKSSGEKGFLLLNDFKPVEVINESLILKDRLYKNRSEAFHSGCQKMQNLVSNDFEEYLKDKKREIRKQQRIPRKMIRDFIKSCNKNDFEGILKNLDQNLIFEKRINWKTESVFNGINEFKSYIKSEKQDLCNMEFIIRSSWDLNLPKRVTIGVKYFPDLKNNDKMTLKQREIMFEFQDNKISRITEEK